VAAQVIQLGDEGVIVWVALDQVHGLFGNTTCLRVQIIGSIALNDRLPRGVVFWPVLMKIAAKELI